MECGECGADGAEVVRVEYVEATTERLPLCEPCVAEFEDGDLVTEVTAVSTSEDSG